MTPSMLHLVAERRFAGARAQARRLGVDRRARRAAGHAGRAAGAGDLGAAVAGAAAGAGAAAADLGLADLPRAELRRAGRARQPRGAARDRAPRTGRRCSAMGVLTGYLGAAPGLVWASGVMFVALAPVLVPVAIWIYTLVFAFAALWFAHYALAALQALRAEAAAADAAGASRRCRRLAPLSSCCPRHELRPDHHRRRDPLRQARGQAPAQGDRSARGARPRRCPGRATSATSPSASPPTCATPSRPRARGDVVFSCGGIGATPDDHTRQCAGARARRAARAASAGARR